MRIILSILTAVLLVSCAAPPARAQDTATVVATCGTLPLAYLPGSVRSLTQDATGTLCTVSGGGGGGSATAANQTLQITQETAINTILGLQADATCSTDNGTCTIAALAKRGNQRLTTINTTLGTPFQAGGSIGNTTFASTVADGANVVEGAVADAAATQGGTGTLSAKLRLMTTQFNTLNTTIATSANQTTMGTNQTTVQGPVPAGAATATKFNLGGGEYRSTKPTLTDGQQVPAQMGTRGASIVQLSASDSGNSISVFGSPADALPNSNFANVYAGQNALFSYNGTTWDRYRSIIGAVAAGTGTTAVAIAPTSAASGGITPGATGSALSSLVLKAGAGNAYNASATNLTATAGFLVLLNLTAAPADGAITPLACAPLPANGNVSINYGNIPGVFSTGITAVVTSASTCFTKTTGVITAFISGQVQ